MMKKDGLCKRLWGWPWNNPAHFKALNITSVSYSFWKHLILLWVLLTKKGITATNKSMAADWVHRFVNRFICISHSGVKVLFVIWIKKGIVELNFELFKNKMIEVDAELWILKFGLHTKWNSNNMGQEKY